MAFDEVWEWIIENQGKEFRTRRGLEYTYAVKGGCIYFSRKEKELTLASVKMAYEEAEKLNWLVKGPKKLKCFGASYLFPVFLEMGLIRSQIPFEAAKQAKLRDRHPTGLN